MHTKITEEAGNGFLGIMKDCMEVKGEGEERGKDSGPTPAWQLGAVSPLLPASKLHTLVWSSDHSLQK